MCVIGMNMFFIAVYKVSAARNGDKKIGSGLSHVNFYQQPPGIIHVLCCNSFNSWTLFVSDSMSGITPHSILFP